MTFNKKGFYFILFSSPPPQKKKIRNEVKGFDKLWVTRAVWCKLISVQEILESDDELLLGNQGVGK